MDCFVLVAIMHWREFDLPVSFSGCIFCFLDRFEERLESRCRVGGQQCHNFKATPTSECYFFFYHRSISRFAASNMCQCFAFSQRDVIIDVIPNMQK